MSSSVSHARGSSAGSCAPETVPIAPGSRAVDVGCGWGDTAIELARKVGPDGFVLGLDCCDAFLEKGRRDAAAERLGVPIQYVGYDTAGKVTDAVSEDAWDVCFLAIDPVRLVVHLARVIGDDVMQGLDELYAEDFALGLACVDKVPGAVTQVDRLCGPAIDAAVARIDRSPELRDEVRQTLWQRLFVGTPDQAPRGGDLRRACRRVRWRPSPPAG